MDKNKIEEIADFISEETGGFDILKHKELTAFIVEGNSIIGFVMDEHPFSEEDIIENQNWEVSFEVKWVTSVPRKKSDGDKEVFGITSMQTNNGKIVDPYSFLDTLGYLVEGEKIKISPKLQVVGVNKCEEWDFYTPFNE